MQEKQSNRNERTNQNVKHEHDYTMWDEGDGAREQNTEESVGKACRYVCMVEKGNDGARE